MTDKSLSEQELQRVIARAVEIDARGGTETLARLREIAAELNISPAAVEQALAENVRERHTPPQTHQGRSLVSLWSRFKRFASVNTAVVAAGAIAGGLVGNEHASHFHTAPLSVAFTSFTLGSLTLVSLLIILGFRERTSVVPMMRQLITFWMSWLFALSFTIQAFHEDIAGFAVAGLAIAMVAGVIARRLRQRSGDNNESLGNAAGTFATPVP